MKNGQPATEGGFDKTRPLNSHGIRAPPNNMTKKLSKRVVYPNIKELDEMSKSLPESLPFADSTALLTRFIPDLLI